MTISPGVRGAYKRGYASSIALPLKVNGKVIGALNLYAPEPDAFDSEEVKLLEELADNITFGIMALRLRKEGQKAEEALRRSEKKYRLVVENINEIIYIVQIGDDPLNGRVEFVSSTVENILGYSPEEFIKNQDLWKIIIHPEDLSLVEEVTKEILITKKPKNMVCRLRHKKTGEYIWIEDTVVPQVDKSGKTVALFGAARDITDRRKAEKLLQTSIEKFSAVHEIDRGIIEKRDLSSLLEFIVSKAKELTETDAAFYALVEGDVIRHHISTGLRKDIFEDLEIKKGTGMSWLAIEEKKPVVIEDFFSDRKINNRPYHVIKREGLVSFIAVPFFSGKGEPLGVLFVANRRKTKFTEEQIETLTTLASQTTVAIEHAKLYHDLKEVHEKLQQAYNELKSLDELKRNIIANVSHELQTPLTIVKGVLQLLMMEEEKENNRELLKLALSALYRQKNIIMDLIKVAEIEKGKMRLNIEPVKFEELIRVIDDDFKPLLLKGKIKMSIDPEKDLLEVKADKAHIKHVIRNLINNAIKFNREGGEIIIEAEKKKDKVEICIKDTGIGIHKDKLHKIFHKFYQVDSSTSRHYSGTGMGLALVKEIVEAHGGEVSVESKEGRGTIICFTLPLAE